jgi:polyisoprenoid-binding protein YceI
MALLGLVAAATSVSMAQAAHYEIDGSHSHVGFKVRHLVSKLPGEFKEFEGTFDFDDKKPEDSKVVFKVKTASVYTNNEKRDDHLKGEDFFDVSKYPEMKFESATVTKAGKDKYKLKGNLTIRGVTKPVTFDVVYSGTAKDPWGNQRAGFTATTKINRKDFGLVWNKALDQGGLMIGDDVEITLEIEAIEKSKS